MLQDFLKSVVTYSRFAVEQTAGGANNQGPVILNGTTGVKFVMAVTAPIKLLKWGFVVTTVGGSVGAAGPVLTLQTTTTPGSGYTNVDTLTVAANTSFAIGTGAYRDPFTVATQATPPSVIASEPTNAGPLGSTPGLVVSGQTQIVLAAGSEIAIALTTAATNALGAVLFFEYVLLPISKPSGYGTTAAGTVSLTEQLTRFAS